MKVAIIYYSTYGHIVSMAEAVKAGLDNSGKALTVDIFQVPETLSKETLEALHAPPKADYPVASVDTLTQYDAFVFGYPTRFGTLPAQFVDFLGATGQLWATGALHGKPVSLFSSVSSPGGSQETVFRNFFSYIAHHGLIYIPLGYAKAFAELTNLDEVHGGTPYGAVCYAGSDGSRPASDLEKKIATIQGEAFAESASKFVGVNSVASSTEEKKEEKTAEKETEAETTKTAPAARAQQSAPAPKEEKKGGCGVQCLII